jgi:hypothetical protein
MVKKMDNSLGSLSLLNESDLETEFLSISTSLEGDRWQLTALQKIWNAYSNGQQIKTDLIATLSHSGAKDFAKRIESSNSSWREFNNEKIWREQFQGIPSPRDKVAYQKRSNNYNNTPYIFRQDKDTTPSITTYDVQIQQEAASNTLNRTDYLSEWDLALKDNNKEQIKHLLAEISDVFCDDFLEKLQSNILFSDVQITYSDMPYMAAIVTSVKHWIESKYCQGFLGSIMNPIQRAKVKVVIQAATALHTSPANSSIKISDEKKEQLLKKEKDFWRLIAEKAFSFNNQYIYDLALLKLSMPSKSHQKVTSNQVDYEKLLERCEKSEALEWSMHQANTMKQRTNRMIKSHPSVKKAPAPHKKKKRRVRQRKNTGQKALLKKIAPQKPIDDNIINLRNPDIHGAEKNTKIVKTKGRPKKSVPPKEQLSLRDNVPMRQAVVPPYKLYENTPLGNLKKQLFANMIEKYKSHNIPYEILIWRLDKCYSNALISTKWWDNEDIILEARSNIVSFMDEAIKNLLQELTVRENIEDGRAIGNEIPQTTFKSLLGDTYMRGYKMTPWASEGLNLTAGEVFETLMGNIIERCEDGNVEP